MPCKSSWRRFGGAIVSGTIGGSLLIAGAASRGETPAPTTAQLPLLTTAHQAHSLSPSEAAKAYPVRLRGVVTYYDPYQEGSHSAAGQRALFVADSTGSIFVKTGTEALPPIHAGSMVEITGATDPGGYAPIIINPKVRMLPGSMALPKPVPATIAEMLTGKLDGQWVSVDGVVHAVSLEGAHAILTIATEDGTLSTTTDRESGADYHSLVDARILLAGVATPLVDAKRRMVGARVLFPGMQSIKIEERGPANPFALPVQSLGSLFQYSASGPSRHRSHIRGTVTLSWPGQTVCITDASEGLCMQTADRTALHVGEVVDVAGFLALENYRPTLTDATVRGVAGGNAINPAPISTASAFTGDHDGELVRMEGTLIDKLVVPGKTTLLLSSGGTAFSAVLPSGSVSPDRELDAMWPDGSTVALTGVFVGKVDQREIQRREGVSTLESFQILLQTPGDVVVIAAPTWWNGRHTLTVLGSLAVLTLGILCWVLVLRHQVQLQTSIIRSNEQRFRYMAQHDALTGLYARTVLLERLEEEIKRAARSGGSLALFMIDVDGFKQINDSMGHAVGDEVLAALSKRILNSVRETDTVARMGGDEFIALLPGVRGALEAEKIAAHLLEAVSAPFAVGGEAIPVSVSIGVTVFPEGGKDGAELLRSADVAMYRAKALGRNRCQVVCGEQAQVIAIQSRAQLA